MEVTNLPLLMDQISSLSQLGLDRSTQLLADMLVFNCSIKNRFILVSYADSLYADQQYRRALHYYRQSLATEAGDQSDFNNKNISECRIKWSIYQCYFKLKQYEDAMDILLSVPVKERTLRMELTLAKLYHYFKKDNNNAIIYYRMVLMQCPFAIEAVLALLSLGVPLAQLAMIFRQQSPSLTSFNWLSIWLKAQENVSFFQYPDALREFDNLTKLGFILSPENNSQVAWIMSKLLKKSSALELFRKARIQDPYILNYTDTYGRLLTSKSLAPSNEQLADQLLSVSTLHPQPWIVKVWSSIRRTRLSNVPHIQIILNKVGTVISPLEPAKAEKSYLIGTISLSRQRYEDAIIGFQEAVRIDPSFFEAYESLLRCYFICRGFKAAFSAMNAALRSIKIPSQQLYLEAIVFASKPETEAKARKCLENAVKHDKTFEKASIALCHSLTQNVTTISKAIEMLNDVLEVYQSPALHYELGKCFEKVKRFKEAIQQYEISLRMDPDYNDALTNLLSLQERLASSDGGMEFEGTGRGDENEPEIKENISDLLFGDIGEPIAPSNRDFDGDVSAFPMLEFGEEEEGEGEGGY